MGMDEKSAKEAIAAYEAAEMAEAAGRRYDPTCWFLVRFAGILRAKAEEK